MRHVHLFEFEDLPWFPRALREAITDFLSATGELAAGSYEDLAAPLREALATCGDSQIVDLCSGAGGPAAAIARLLRDKHGVPVKLLLTDLYPNLTQWRRRKDASAGEVDFCPDPVDATRVPPGITGFRLLCNGFHHFRPDEARAILRDAVEQRRGIAIFEAIDPGALGVVQPFVLVAMMLALTPFLRPFRWSRLLLTYALPAAPLFLFWDGMVSWLRIYSPDDLRELTASLDAPAYDWQIGRGRTPGAPVQSVFLIGVPRSSSPGRNS